MRVHDLLAESFQRVRDGVQGLLDDVDDPTLQFRPDPEANSIAWLLWHLTRIQDDHICALAGAEQTWTAGGWTERFGLPFDPSATGYRQRPSEVAAVKVSADLLLGYHDAVHRATGDFLSKLDDADLDRIVDERWDPPVTMLVRLVSVINDDLQHVGQAAYLRGLAERSG